MQESRRPRPKSSWSFTKVGLAPWHIPFRICRGFWGHGYATEAARAVLDYAFDALGVKRVEALIRPDNIRSVRLAQRLGMQPESTTEHMGHEHCVYVITR